LALRINISVSDDPALYLYSGGAKETPQFLSNLVNSMMRSLNLASPAFRVSMLALSTAFRG
ncbi:MAG: hypothetical protein WB803_02125, partial [Pseudolabrys sp.]